MNKLIIKMSLLLIIPLILAGLVFGDNVTDLGLPNTKINPGSFYYPFKRLIEKGRERITFSEEGKISLYKSLLKIRLSELNYIVNKKFLSEVQGSSERFAYTAGVLAEEVKSFNQSDEKGNLIKQFELYSKFLNSLRDQYPANSSFWMLIQHDINSLSILSDQLK